MLVVTGNTFLAHRELTLVSTADLSGRRLIDAVMALDEDNPTVVEEWSPRYFALIYGRLVSGELAHVRVIDSRGNLSALPAAGSLPPVLYTTRDMLYIAGPDVWAERLGALTTIESGGDDLVTIRRRPRLADEDISLLATDVASDVAVARARAWINVDGDVRLTVEWRALRAPALDYRVFVHVSDRPQIIESTDVLAQGDRLHPVGRAAGPPVGFGCGRHGAHQLRQRPGV